MKMHHPLLNPEVFPLQPLGMEACLYTGADNLTSTKPGLRSGQSLLLELFLQTNQATHIILLSIQSHVFFLQPHHYIHISLIIFHFIQGSGNICLLEHLIDEN